MKWPPAVRLCEKPEQPKYLEVAGGYKLFAPLASGGTHWLLQKSLPDAERAGLGAPNLDQYPC